MKFTICEANDKAQNTKKNYEIKLEKCQHKKSEKVSERDRRSKH